MIPLVVLDLDGTIIGASGVVQECVWEAAARAREAGVKVAVCTGRPGFGVAQRVAQRLGPDNPHVFQSGAYLGYPDGRTIKAVAIKSDDLNSIIEVSRQRGAVLELYTPSSLYVERTTALSEAHASMIGVTAIVRDLEDVAANEPVVRAQWVLPEGESAEIVDLAPEGVNLAHANSPALPGISFISITRLGVSKASAVMQLAEQMRIPLAQVMAVGDSHGDLPMLEVVGHPRVMANASPELLERFPSVGDVEACGAVHALDEAIGASGSLLHSPA